MGDESQKVFKPGYGNPPLHTRFKKGGPSPNPAGRPKGSRNLRTDFLAEMNERIPVTEGGKRRRYSKGQILLKALIAQAMKGDIRAAGKVVDLYLKLFGTGEPATTERNLSTTDQEILKAFLERYSKRSSDEQR